MYTLYAIYIYFVRIHFSVRQNDRIRINICFQTMTRAGEIVPYTQLSIFVGRVVWGEIQAGSKWFYNDVVWCWCRTNSYLILIQNAYFAKNYVDYDWKVSLFFSYTSYKLEDFNEYIWIRIERLYNMVSSER